MRMMKTMVRSIRPLGRLGAGHVGREGRGPRQTRRTLAVSLVACLTFLSALVAATPASAQTTAYAVTQSNVLIAFEVNAPATVTTIGPIKDVAPGNPPLAAQIIAIDFRPLTGQLYALGNNSTVYTIDPVTGIASPLQPLNPATVIAGNAGLDFDPVNDRIRIVTDTGQNLRINPSNSTVVTDLPVNGAGSPVVTGIAYTNNFAAPDRDTLFGIDSAHSALVRIGLADAIDGGASQTTGLATAIGPLGVTVDALNGFDITANDNQAFAVMAGAVPASSTLYRLNLSTGAATAVGVVGVAERLRALAVFTRAVTIYGLTADNKIVTFLSAAPGTLLPAPTGAAVAIIGLAASEKVLGIDVRPTTGEVYGVTSASRLITLNPASGAATVKAPLSVTLTGTEVGVDFDPTSDRLRIIGDDGQNLRVDPDTGAAVADGVVGISNLTGIGYTNSIAGATSTALYGIATQGDAANDSLVSINPTTGATTFIGTLIGPSGPVNTSVLTGLDIAASDNTAYIAVTAPAGTSTQIYVVNLTTGALTLTGNAGTVGGGVVLRGIAVASPGRVRLTNAAYSVVENAGNANITIERIDGSDGPISAKLTTSNGTATSPGDYLSASFTVEFLSGETLKTVAVPITNDSVHENDETVNLTLSDPRLGASLLAPTAGVLTIIDDDLIGSGTAPVVTITDPTTDPTFTATSLFVSLAGTAADDGTIQQVRWTSDRGFSGTAVLAQGVGATQWFANSVELRPGVNVLTVTATDNDGNNGVDTITITVNELQYFLAEGAIGGFFDTDLLIANPNAAPAPITVTYLKEGGGTVSQNLTVQPTSRITIRVDDVPGLENVGAVSSVVTSPAGLPVLVERTMRWDSTGYGASGDHASDGLRSKWFFAEGSQGFFFTYFLLANPNAIATDAKITFLREGVAPLEITRHLDPFSRFTLDAGSVPEIQNSSFGAIVEFLQAPGAAERSMYFGTQPLFLGGHESAGVNLPSPQWFLAEGATGPFFETFILVANPNDQSVDVDITYLPSTGDAIHKPTFTLGPKQRATINIEAESTELHAPVLSNAAVSTQVLATRPVLVERSQYWPDPATNWYEAHNAFGLTALDTRWGLAEGRVGGTTEYQTYILLANPGATAADVTITFLRENGSTVTKTYTVAPTSRFNVAVGPGPGSMVPELQDESFGAVLSSTQPIAVERAMYSNATGQVWQAGTNATAVHLP
jgi:hypothetical protein